MGYVPADADFNGVSPVRVLDTRNGTGGHGAPLAGRETITVEVVGRGDVPASGVGAVWTTLTSTGATTESFVRAWPTGLDWSTSSVLNTDVGVDTPNLVLVPVGEDGTISLFNHAGSTDLVVDVIGWVPQHGT